jgi:hypothetical protein
MTVPEENRPKTDSTDEVVERPSTAGGQRANEGRTMREALEDAGVTPESAGGAGAGTGGDGTDEAPGAGSGAEDEPHERVVPGTASATEGYAHTDEGTADADPLAGVEDPQAGEEAVDPSDGSGAGAG